MNSGKNGLFMAIKGLHAMRCAAFCQEDGHLCREVPGVYPMKTVVVAMKTVAETMKTVVVAIKCQIPI